MRDTIFALASGAGTAGVAVIRVSGPEAGAALLALCGRIPAPRRATTARLRDPSGATIDRGLALWFPGPASFTGENVAELHVHGGRAVVAATVAALAALPDLRPAEAGEFARRAFEHGKLDLTAAEGLADLVAAETEAQRRQALRQFEGALGRLYDAWRERMLRLLAHAEAAIDFADEDLPGDLLGQALAEARAVHAEVVAHLADQGRGERLRAGLSVAILGAPNVGKSSLLNVLAKREVAIVSATAGTTRDVIEIHMDLQGFPVIFADTAGLRELAEDDAAGQAAIEQEGIRRALHRASHSDLKLAVFDATCWPVADPATSALVDASTIVVFNKTDLACRPNAAAPPGPAPFTHALAVQPVSALTGAGIGDLLALLGRIVAERFGAQDAPAISRLRHRQALEDCRDALARAFQAPAVELAAEDLRLAARALGRITGRVDVEDILDVIFREFCIGK